MSPAPPPQPESGYINLLRHASMSRLLAIGFGLVRILILLHHAKEVLMPQIASRPLHPKWHLQGLLPSAQTLSWP